VLVVLALCVALLVVALAHSADSTHPSGPPRGPSRLASAGSPARTAGPAGSVPEPLHVVVPPPSSAWRVAALLGGRPAVWLAHRAGVTLLRVDQQRVHLILHAGSSDGGPAGWRYGDRITPAEIHRVVAAVNGAFKLTYTNVGFMSGGHVAVPLRAGLASLVTYSDGTTDIGAWRAGVPGAGKTVFSVLQNQRLLVDRGVAAATVSDCVIKCWGGTVGLLTVIARSGLGITRGGKLVWAAGEQLSPADLAGALIGAGAVRAIELDINPWWVAGYLYLHHPGGPSPVALVAGQRGVAGAFLEPYSRDFLTFVAEGISR